ncbi:MAG TPA: zinc dependent phospholipase C family protein [Lachnospiraceae bacterium]
MPTTFTHDKFGRDVYQRLPKNIRAVIRENKDAYLLGLQGPDIFFYYYPFIKNKVFRLGLNMHKEESFSFFENAIREYKRKTSGAILAYLLGFACHFMLDSTCHPFIYDYQKRHNLMHSEIEACLDKYEMLSCGINPYKYQPSSSVRLPVATTELLRLFPTIGKRQWKGSIKGLKFFTNLCVLSNIYQRKMVLWLFRGSRLAKELRGRCIMDSDKEACLEAVRLLMRIYYKEAVKETPDILVNLYECAVSDHSLSQRFKRNYNE